MSLVTRLFLLAGTALASLWEPSMALAQQSPVVEMHSTLGSIDVYPTDGRIKLNKDMVLSGIFIPDGATVSGVIRKEGEAEPIFQEVYQGQKLYGAFTRLSARPDIDRFLTQPGKYTFSFEVGRIHID